MKKVLGREVKFFLDAKEFLLSRWTPARYFASLSSRGSAAGRHVRRHDRGCRCRRTATRADRCRPHGRITPRRSRIAARIVDETGSARPHGPSGAPRREGREARSEAGLTTGGPLGRLRPAISTTLGTPRGAIRWAKERRWHYPDWR